MQTRWHRTPLNVNIRVFDGDTGQLLGHVQNLSLQGVCLSSSGPLEKLPTHLDLALPWQVAGKQRLELGVQLCWQHQVGSTHWRAGFSVDHCSDQALGVLEKLSSQFG